MIARWGKISGINGDLSKFTKKIHWSENELREIWMKAGVHLYLESNDIIYSGFGWLTLHTKSGGDKTIKFPAPIQLVDPLKGEILSKNTISYKLFLQPNSTRIFRIFPPDR